MSMRTWLDETFENFHVISIQFEGIGNRQKAAMAFFKTADYAGYLGGFAKIDTMKGHIDVFIPKAQGAYKYHAKVVYELIDTNNTGKFEVLP